jgi:hypothetical protein
MSSSDDDDMPLSALTKGKRSRPKDDDSEAEFDDEASDEPAEEEDNDFIAEDSGDDEDGDYDSDDSDDIPLSKLKSPPKKKAAAKKPAAKSKATKTKAAPKKKAAPAKKKATTAKKAASKPAASVSSSYVSASTELYAKCDKGKLIQSLLARWWYVYTWPEPETLLSSTPKGYDSLDGFPGVYICTSGDSVGKFLDKRNHKTAPSFRNFAKKTSEELRDDLLKAVEKQRAALIKVEGKGTVTEKELKDLEKWATKLNCSKADKDAVKVLKAAKLTV